MMSVAAQNGVAGGAALAWTILLMYLINAFTGWTFPPEVSASFQTAVSPVMAVLLSKIGVPGMTTAASS